MYVLHIVQGYVGREYVLLDTRCLYANTYVPFNLARGNRASVGPARKIRDKQIHKPLRRLRLGTNVSEFRKLFIQLSRRGKSPSQSAQIRYILLYWIYCVCIYYILNNELDLNIAKGEKDYHASTKATN